MRTVGSSKGCLSQHIFQKNIYHYTDNYPFVNKKVMFSSLFLTYATLSSVQLPDLLPTVSIHFSGFLVKGDK